MGTPVGDRMEKMRARKIAAGLRQVNLWVPADQVEAIRRFATELVIGKPVVAREIPLPVDLDAQVQLLATFIKKPSYEDRDMLKKQGWRWNGQSWEIITPVRSMVSTAMMIRDCIEGRPVIKVVALTP